MRCPTRHVIALLLGLVFLALIYLFIGKGESNQATAEPRASEPTWTPSNGSNVLENNDFHHYHDTDQTRKGEIGEVGTSPHSQVRRTRNKQHLSETIGFPSRLAEFNFDACDMSTCFDFTLCNASDTLRVHIVASTTGDAKNLLNIPGESNIIHERILKIIRQSKFYEPDPSKACLFVPEDDTLDRDPLSTSFRQLSFDISKPEHRFGMNYLIFNLYSGTWPDYKENDFSGLDIGAAILAKASNSLTYHRDGFDISIPLFSYLHPMTDGVNDNMTYQSSFDQHRKGNTSENISRNKTLFLTFKGKRYVIGTGSETRNSLYHLNNQKDVIMLTTCRHGKKWREVDDARCLEEDTSYEQYDFVKLMNESIFCLTPRGRRLGSFRFLEALNYTCIPVVLGDGWVWPFSELIDWSTAAVQFPESDIFLVPDTLKDFSRHNIRIMQMKCRDLYDRYFASINKIVLTTLEIIDMRIKRALNG